MPSANPDGFEISNEGDESGIVGRNNLHNVDLNRNFPDQFGKTYENMVQEPETKLIMKWSKSHAFVLSGNLHAGSLVASYPFDGSANMTAYYSASPDDETFKHLATVYSRAHKSMYLGRPKCDVITFPNGITNGNNWYPLQGGMQDWNYLFTGCMEITLELGCTKYPWASEISTYWNDNKYSLVSFLSEVHRALHGFVLDGSTNSPVGGASIHVEEFNHLVNSTPYFGDYWRLLPPTGIYHVWASKIGYFDSVKYAVNASLLPYIPYTSSEQLNFTLWPEDQSTLQWSNRLDYDIPMNRLPKFIKESTYEEAIKNLFKTSSHLIQKYFRLYEIKLFNSLESYNNNIIIKMSTVYGVSLSVPDYRYLKTLHSNYDSDNHDHNDAALLQPHFDKIRIVILAGLNSNELISTEMTMRLLRHLYTALDSSSSEIWRLLATSQLLIFPYLDPVGIHKSLSIAKKNSVGDSQRTCGSTSADHNDGDIFDNSNFQRMMHHFQPHLVILLESNNSSYPIVNKANRTIQLPFTAVHIPKDLSKRISSAELFHNLAVGFGSGVEDFVNNLFNCTTQSPQAVNKFSSSGKRVLELFKVEESTSASSVSSINSNSQRDIDTVADDDDNNSNNKSPLIVRLHTGCQHLSSCSYLANHQLPELWHYTLIGLDRLLSAVRNLSFCGQLLIESGPLTTNLMTRLIERRQWVAAPNPQMILQPALYFFQHSNQSVDENSSETWLSVKINSSTGYFCELIPPSTYLMFASAGPDNSTLENAYEQVAMAISFHLDHFNGRSHIRLERELDEINFNGPEDIYDYMRKRTTESVNSSCGRMYSIGQSHLGRPIYAFELGPKYTTLELINVNTTSTNSNNNNNNNNKNSNVMPNSELFFDVINDTYPLNDSMKHMPKIAIIGNLHGHDRLTPQLLTHFVNFLCDSRSSQITVNNLLNSATITIIPIPNPDGLYKSWSKKHASSSADWRTSESSLFDNDYCYHSKSTDNTVFPGYTNDAGTDLWGQLISLTGSNLTVSHQWWWESKSKLESLSKSLAPENLALVKWLKLHQVNSIISFPTDRLPDINYDTDPSESQYGRDLLLESYNWLRFLGKLLSPSFHRPSSMCTLSQSQFSQKISKISDRRRRPGDFGSQQYDHNNNNNAQRLENTFAKAAALSLSLASMNPTLALEETENFQLQSSLSFAPPLPLMIPPSVGLTLCPGCFSPTPTGVARVWTDYRFPSLLLALIEHTSLTGLGSLGLIGHVHDSNDQPISWVRVHIDYMRSELSTGSTDQNGHFSVVLPPGVYRITLRAKGYLDLSEIINVDIMKSPIHRVFRMKHVGGLSPAYRLYVVGMIASIVAIFSLTLTICVCYHFCCHSRVPYAIVRRSVGRWDKSSPLSSSSHQTKRGPYSLLAMDDIHTSYCNDNDDDK
ncbi:unnamed protein product [Trichobilharzia szidati]|nr:unnamed protein product [Trichobilharzia szidati]